MSEFNPQDYWEGILRERFDVTGVGHAGLGKHYNTWLYRVRKHVFKREMAALSHRGAAVLDVGSGTGFYIERWKEIGVKSVTGSDIANVAVTELRKRFPNSTFFQADIGGTVDIRGEYDIISAFDVLFHIVDDSRFERAIQNIYRALKPGGYFVFSDNFLHGPPQRARDQVSRSLEDITRVVEEAGFQIIKRVPVVVLMSNPIDSKNRFHTWLWRVAKYVIARSEVAGFTIGALLYVPELILTSILDEGPSTEMMICRKPTGVPRTV